MLKTTGISKSFGNKAILQEISFSANRGDVIGLAGENGAGKSTLLNVLATLMKPDSGSIELQGLDYAKDKKKVRSLIGFVPQELAIWEQLTVEENMKFFEKLSWKDKTTEELRNLCLDMKLDKWKEKAATLSGGQKRKLNLAISLIHEPALLLLDEPTVGIDMRSKKEIISYLKQLAAASGTIIVYTSHDMDEIKELCNQVVCIGTDPFYYDLLQGTGKPLLKF